MTPEQPAVFVGSEAMPIVLKQGGAPFSDHLVDAADVIRPCAHGRLGGRWGNADIRFPAPLGYADLSPVVASRLGRPTGEPPVRGFPEEPNRSRAIGVLGFTGQYSIRGMVGGALGSFARDTK